MLIASHLCDRAGFHAEITERTKSRDRIFDLRVNFPGFEEQEFHTEFTKDSEQEEDFTQRSQRTQSFGGRRLGVPLILFISVDSVISVWTFRSGPLCTL
jgi:hypothetical protein